MKPRHQPIKSRDRSRLVVEDESGSKDVAVRATTPFRETRLRQQADLLRNVELERTPRGEFLVFSTEDGRRFSLNLDCQEEYGLEARMTLQQWAAEQEWH